MFVRDTPIGEQLLKTLKSKNLKLCGAESCTGGMISSAITAIAGSSEVFNGCIVSYTNEIKQKLLSVTEETLQKHTAVSEECAQEMAKGALNSLNANISYAVTGYAGPKSQPKDTLCGKVCFAFCTQKKTVAQTIQFLGQRGDVRQKATMHVIQELLKIAKEM